MKPPPLSRSLTRFAHFTARPPSPTNKENTNLATNNTTNSIIASSLGGGSSSSPLGLDCYAFTEEENTTSTHKTSHGEGVSSLIKHKHQRLTQPVSLSTNTDQNVRELKSSKSSYPHNLKEATLLPHNDSASLHTAANSIKSKQVNKKPTAAPQAPRKTRNSQRNAVAAATNYQTRSTTTTTMDVDNGTIIVGVISAACAGTVGDKQHSLNTQAIIGDTNMKGLPLPLSDRTHAFDSDLSLECSGAAKSSSAREYHHEMDSNTRCTDGQQQLRVVLQSRSVTSAIVDEEYYTMPSVYRESPIMRPALRSSAHTQGNVESGGGLPGLSEHSHVHNINTAIDSAALDDASSNAESSSLVICDGALGNPKTDSIPTQTSASDSKSPQQPREATMCIHNDSHESAEMTSSHVNAGLEGTSSTVGGQKQRGRGRGRRGGKRRRGRGRRGKKDPNESWIRTNSQPQTCDHVEDLEFSQNEAISCSLPERSLVESHPDTMQESVFDMIWEESCLPNMESLPEGREKESSLRRRAGVGKRASFRGRGRRGSRGRGQRDWGTMTTTTTMNVQFSGRVTRSRTAALLKSKMEEAEDKEKPAFSPKPEEDDLPPPPAKKQKPKDEYPTTEVACSEGNLNRVAIKDISASPANTVCSANDGATLSDPSTANSVCSVARDGSTVDTLFSTANASDGSKHSSPTVTIRPPCEESVLFETPSLHATICMCPASEAAAAGSIDTAVTVTSTKLCKSSSSSPPFAQCSSTTTSTQPQAQHVSIQLVCLYVCVGFA